jgi:hypothetical protein
MQYAIHRLVLFHDRFGLHDQDLALRLTAFAVDRVDQSLELFV